MSKLIKDLPSWVQEIVFERQKEQGNEPNINLRVNAYMARGGFTWDFTKERYEIWYNVYNGNYQPLADFHGITIDENGNQTTPTTKDPVDGYGGC